METNVHYTIVGAFVISLVAALVLSILWLSSGFSTQTYSLYMVYMQESVSGLSIDSAVEYNGVNVGAVKSIQLDPNDPHLVDLVLKIKSDTPVTRGTSATLTTRGITGLAFMALKDKSADLRPLVAEKGQPYPVIPTSPSIFLRLETVLSRLSLNIQKVSEAIQTLLDTENQESIKVTLANLREMTGTLNKATFRLEPLLQSSNNAMLMLQNQTLPATARLMTNLNDTVRNLTGLSSELRQNPSILIRGVQPRPLGPGEQK